MKRIIWIGFVVIQLACVSLWANDTTSTGIKIFARPKGVFYALTMLVDFSDQPANETNQRPEDIDQWLNQEGFAVDGNNGSVRDYFWDISNHQFDYRNDVTAYYRAKHPKAWYEALHDGFNYEGSDSLRNEVLDYFDAVVDFSKYDNNKDGFTDALNIVYIGPQGTYAKGLWPHTSSVGQLRDGVVLAQYQMTNLYGTYSLGTFVHESGHMIFGWPDLYYFGDYCLMGEGATVSPKNPVPVNDFYRAAQGWIPFVDVNAGTRLTTSIAEATIGYRYQNPNNPNEGFFWSYQKAWKRRTAIGGMGLILFHYNLGEHGNRNPNHMQLRVMEADGATTLTSNIMVNPGHYFTDFFSSANVDHFVDANWYDGTPSGLRLINIGNPLAEISFTLDGTGEYSSSSQATTQSSSSSAGVSSSSGNGNTPLLLIQKGGGTKVNSSVLTPNYSYPPRLANGRIF